MLEIVKKGAVMHYGVLEEFVSTVLEAVPDMLTYREGVQLVMGLRARVVLELCRTDELTSSHTIQPHLTRIKAHITEFNEERSDSEVKTSMTNFFQLVDALVDDPGQRDAFYQNVFPTVFGPKYDSALQALMKKFLSSLQKMLPVPTLEQTADWLSVTPSIQKEELCVELVKQPQPLNTLIQHHRCHGDEVLKGSSSSGEDCILSSLSYHFQKADTTTRNASGNSAPEGFSIGNDFKLVEETHETTWNVVGGEERPVDVDLSEDRGHSANHMAEKEPFVWTDNEAELLLQVTLDYKTKKLQENVDWESCPFKYSDIMDKFVAHYPRQPADRKRFPHVSAVTEAQLTAKLKLIRFKYRAAVRTGKRSGHGRVIDLYFELCSQIFDRPQKSRVVMNKRNRRTDLKSSAASTHNPKSQPLDEDKGCRSPTEKVNPLPELALSPEPSEEPMCKRSSRAKTCSVCGDIFTSSLDLTKHMRCHTEQTPSLDEEEEMEEGGDGYAPISSDEDDLDDGSFKIPSSPAKTGDSPKRNRRRAFSSSSSSQALSEPDAGASSVQSSKLSLICAVCRRGFSRYNRFVKHQRKCSQKISEEPADGIVILACNLQSTDLPQEKELEENGRPEMKDGKAALLTSSAHHQTKPGVLRCTMCEKDFSHMNSMRNHYWRFHNVHGSYPCPLCKRTFVSPGELVRHHQNYKLYQCSSCTRCYTTLKLLDAHKKGHACTPPVQKRDRDRPPLICSYCGKKFSRTDTLAAHMVIHGEGGYPCPTCGKKFRTKLTLKWHEYKHTGQNPYLCETCGTGFPCVTQLRIHMVKHTEERPFKCEDCGMCFKRGCELQGHRQSRHSTVRPFVCEVCGKGFKIKQELKRHLVIHTGKRPFICPRCGNRFKIKSTLRQHMRRKTSCKPT